MEWGKIYENKGLIPKMYKEPIHLKSKSKQII